MKKMAALLLTALIAFSMTGCGDSSNSDTQADDTAGKGTASDQEEGDTKNTDSDEQAQDDPASGADGTETLKVAMELAYPPFETRDDAGNPAGVSVDLMKAFGEYAGYEIQIENTAWDGLIPALQTGAADLVISSMTITDERKELIDFSDPYANALLAVLANEDSEIASIDDLNQKGKVVAVKSGSTGHMYAEKNLTEAEVMAMPDESACVMEVSQGRAGGFIYDQLTIYRNWQLNPDTTAAVFIPFQEPEKWGIAVRKGNQELLDQLNAFLAEYKENGGYDQLTEKHLAEEKKAFDELDFQWFFDMDE